MTISRAHRPGSLLLALILGLCLAPAGLPAAGDGDGTPPPARDEKPALSVPAEVQGLLNLGESLNARGDYAAGIIAYRQALEKAGDHESIKAALCGLARMHRKEGSFTKSVALYERVIRDYPNDPSLPDLLLELGRTQRAMGANKSALRSFYSVINSTLKIPVDQFEHYQLLTKTAQFEIAETYFISGNFKEAAKFFTRVRLLDLAPVDRARAHFKLAYAQQLDGDLTGAIVTLQTFVEKYPDDENVPEARYLLATILRSLNRPAEALAITLELLREEHDRSKADPRSWIYWQRRTGNQLANEFFLAGDTINALAIYQHLSGLSEDPRWCLPIIYQTALCFERLRQVAEAQHAYATIVEATKTHINDPATPELSDLNRMAAWRLQYLSWHESTDRQLTEIIATTTGTIAAIQPDPPTPSIHDTSGNPRRPSSSLQ